MAVARLLWVGVVLALAGGFAKAQTYPAKSIRIVVPYPAGGGTDITARPIAARLSEKWGVSVVIDNRGGATGMIGAELVAKAPGDGYTLLLSAASEVALNVALFPKMAYDPVKDLQPITLATVTPAIFVVHPSLPVKTVKEFVALARARPGQIAYASVGTGSPQHFAGELLRLLAKVDITHIPFKGAAPALTDVLGGHVPSGFIALLPAIPHVKAGRLVPLAVSSKKRAGALPEVPAMSEVGYPDFDISQWFAAWAPAGTPKDIVDRLNAEMVAIIRSPDYQKRMTEQGTDAVGGTASELGAFQRAEIEKYRRIARDAKIKGE
jgi:tripartite-type tricarboxylate transporter receptor subunit TctC